MKDQCKTKKQLIEELEGLRNQVMEPKKRETKRKPVKEDLRESEETFRALAENANDGIFVTIGEGLQAYANKRASEITGYTVAELLRSTIKDLVHTDELEKIMERYRKRLAGEPIPSQYETVIVNKEGKNVPIELTAAKTTWLGQPADLVIIRDITEHKQAEKQLHESEERYRAVIESQIDLISRYLPDTTLTFVNDAYCQFYAKTREELIGHSYLPMVAPEFRELVKKETENLAKNPRPLAGEYLNYRHDGKECWIQWVVQCILGEDGRVVELQAVGRDITERKRMEMELRESEERFRKLVETMKVGLSTVDENGVITYVNDQLCSMLGYSMDEMVGHPNFDFLDEENRQTLECLFAKRKKGEQDPAPYELTWLRKDGQKVHTLMSPTPFFDRGEHHESRYKGAYAIITDITKLKQAEEALEQTRLLLEAVLEQSPVPIVVVSGPDLVVRYKNRAAIDFLGVTDELTYLGLTLPQVKRRQTWQDLNPDGTPTDLLNLPLARALRGETTRNEEYGVIRKDGTQRWELVSGTPIYSRSGELVAGLVVFPDITERKQAEAERQAHMWFIESMIRVNEALYGTPDLEQMMSDALAVVLSIYNCDRASLVYPCDPEAASWRAIMEQSRSEYPGPPALGLEVPVDQDFASAFRTLIASSTPVKFGPGSPHPLPGEIARLSQVQSQLAMAIYPKGDKPWAFVIHQCSYPRVWTSEEERLLQAIGNRLADGLTTLLAHRSLRESEERFRLAFENANSGVCLVDLEGNIARVNHKMCEIFGYTNEELQHMTVNDIAHPEDIDKSPEFKQKTLQGEIDQGTFEKRYFHKKGHDVTCQVSSSLVRDANGSPLYFIVHIQDITERKQAEELLKKERETSLSILENAPYGVALIDKGGQYAYINPEFTTITGYTLQDVPTGKDWAQKAFPDPKYREKMIQVWKEDRQKAHIMNREFSVTCKNGAIREIDIRSTFLREGRAVIVLRDITEQKRTEERMESLQEQLRQSQKMEAIGRLAGGIAHDFNNLLTIIKGYSQLSLIDLKEDTVLKTNIAHIDTATDRAADLVRQLLAFSRRQILEMKVWDLNTILTNLHNMLRRLIGEDIELVTLLAEDLGRVKTDLGWIEQAIMNLVVNARDAMPSGGKLTIETGNADLDEAYVGGRVGVKPGRYVMLSVSDTGVGMTPEVTERLFEPFFSTKDKDKGTGLGLSTVYGIVKQSDGDIWVYSEPGKGSTFKIYLPRVDEPLEEQREKVQSDELLQGCETILLVEDEEEVRKLAVRVLERQGYKVLEARNGDKALRICEHHREPIHLMLTDVVMPGMNGHEVAKRLLSFHPETKVLYMSGYTDDAIVLHGVLVKGVHYIQKPFTVDALTKKVREVLEK